MKKILLILFVFGSLVSSAQLTRPKPYKDQKKVDSLGVGDSVITQAKIVQWSSGGLSAVNTGTSSNITGLLKGNGTSLSAAVAGTDYATTSGVHYEAAVRAATTVAGTLATSFENGDVIDGVTLATNDRILIKDQAAPAENGIYTVNASGAPTRATDFDQTAEITEGDAVTVLSGTDNVGTTWVQGTAGTITVGTTPIVFNQINISTVSDNSITNAKLADFDANSILGNNTGSPADPIYLTASQTRTLLGLVIGTNVQAFDAELTTWAGITPTTVGTSFITLTNPSAVTFPRINADNTVTARSAADLKTDLSLNNVDNTSDATKNSAAATLTNKAITKRVTTSATNNTTPTPTASTDDVYIATSMSVNMVFGSPGAGTEGQELWIRILDNGTARTLGWNSGTNGYRFSTDLPAPTTTILGKTLYLKFMYNDVADKWDCTGIINNYNMLGESLAIVLIMFVVFGGGKIVEMKRKRKAA